jgi:hypothetical protein
MALNVNLPENMKGRTPSWDKQGVLIWAQVVFEGKHPANLANRTSMQIRIHNTCGGGGGVWKREVPVPTARG